MGNNHYLSCHVLVQIKIQAYRIRISEIWSLIQLKAHTADSALRTRLLFPSLLYEEYEESKGEGGSK